MDDSLFLRVNDASLTPSDAIKLPEGVQDATLCELEGAGLACAEAFLMTAMTHGVSVPTEVTRFAAALRSLLITERLRGSATQVELLLRAAERRGNPEAVALLREAETQLLQQARVLRVAHEVGYLRASVEAPQFAPQFAALFAAMAPHIMPAFDAVLGALSADSEQASSALSEPPLEG